ncbi:MAG: UvrB/UvrC motif-containing protein [Deltaproteobacteria bacterium]|nr:UvrB/UvrC motif-containing protein [Deltaproteobacteria bacterium]
MEKPDLGAIPLTPGVYLFSGAQRRVIYVGKAKNLRRRLASYFRPEESLSPKTRAMLEKASRLETISTGTDNEAFLLEASLIKKHRPRYNIILRDDKEYLLFRLDTESPYPRLEITRRRPGSAFGRGGPAGRGKARNRVRVFGPFSSGRDARITWKAIHRAFPLRRCTDRAMRNRAQPCLYHHLRQCLAPCVSALPPEQYSALTEKVILLLEGKSGDLLLRLKAEMGAASENLEFEKAAGLRDQIRAVKNVLERQAVVLENPRDMDVVGLTENERGLSLGLLIVRGGSLLDNRNYFWPGLGLEDAGELFSSFLLQYYGGAETIPPQILLPWTGKRSAGAAAGGASGLCPERSAGEGGEGGFRLGSEEEDIFDSLEMEELLGAQRGGPVRITLPRSGVEENLVSLAAANARDHARKRGEEDLPALLAASFARAEPIERLEAVDVSHTAGKSTRVGLVVFEGGRPLRDAWRTYAFTEGRGDDYAILAAWAARRAAAGPPWPDLLLIDGGKGQLQAVHKVFASLGLERNFLLAAMAKARDAAGRSDRRAGNISDSVFVPGRGNPLNLKPGSPELLFLQYVRNHAHDFAVGRHRMARAASALRGELGRIPGFGPVFVRRLWERFDSLRKMAAAGDEELLRVPGMGPARVKALREHLAKIIDKGRAKAPPQREGNGRDGA